MSHKLYKKKEIKNKSLEKISNIAIFTILCIIFIFLIVKVVSTEIYFYKMMNEMVEGKDYYIENLQVIDKKRIVDSFGSDDENINYFLYYGNSKKDKIQVSFDMFSKYNIGYKFPAYTIDHNYYGATLKSILPNYTNNELSKAIIVVVGCIILIIGFQKWVNSWRLK